MSASGQEFEPRTAEELLPLVYTEVRALAGSYLKNEQMGHTLQPTALANEVYLKIAQSDRRIFSEKSQFMAAVARAIRRILTDHARGKRRVKRGGDWVRLPLEMVQLGTREMGVDLVDFDDALRELARLQPRVAQVVELRVFAEMTIEQVAAVLDIASSTVSDDWATAIAWMSSRLA